MRRVIRQLDRAGVQQLLDWAADEGWNPGDDAAAFHAADPNGFFGAFVDGEMVAGIAGVAYDAQFGFIGLYLCAPQWRGQGHGKAAWDAAMAYLGSRTIGLDGVPEQQANYSKMGFVGLYDTVRMSGTLAMPARAIAQTAPGMDAGIRALDRHGFPAPRDGFLDHWLTPPHQIAALADGGQVVGYAVRRQCRDGHKIGPIFAASTDHAVAILSQFGGYVQIDVPASQTEWLEHLAGLGFKPGFTTRRMYRGPAPDVALSTVFGVTTLELG